MQADTGVIDIDRMPRTGRDGSKAQELGDRRQRQRADWLQNVGQAADLVQGGDISGSRAQRRFRANETLQPVGFPPEAYVVHRRGILLGGSAEISRGSGII
jgi:hypothetical protein